MHSRITQTLTNVAIRKTQKADLKARYPLFVEVGMILTLVLVIGAFRMEMRVDRSFANVLTEQPLVQLEEVLQTKQPDTPAPPPSAPALQPVSEPENFVIVQQMPELIGGLGALQREIRYPEIAKKAGVEGRVIVQFVVNEQGQVEDPVVVRGIGAGCDEEAVKAVRQARFTPGQQRGKSVKVKMSLPVTFRLN